MERGLTGDDDLTSGGGHTCNRQIMCHRNVHLKPV